MRKIGLGPKAGHVLVLLLFAVGVPGCSTNSASREDRSGPGWSTTSEPDPLRWEKTPTPWERERRMYDSMHQPSRRR